MTGAVFFAESPASIINFELLECHLNETPGGEFNIHNGLSVTVKTDNWVSEDMPYSIFNSGCMTCQGGQNTMKVTSYILLIITPVTLMLSRLY